MDKIDLFLLQFSLKIKNRKLLEGGQLHRCYWILSDQGPLVIKELVSSVNTNTNFLVDYEDSENIANYFAQLGLPAVAALKMNDRFVHEFEGVFYIIYPAISGELLKAREIRPSHAKIVGDIFADLHAVGTQIVEKKKPIYLFHSPEEWKELGALSGEFVDTFLLQKILAWNYTYSSHFLAAEKEVIVSHRDLHYGNLLWDNQGAPHIIDWESAGSIDPAMEIVGFALEWSGILAGQFNQEIFRSMLRAYKKTSKRQINHIKRAFYGWLGHCVLGWLFFNLKRALGLLSSEAAEIERAYLVLDGGLLRALHYIARHEDEFVAELEAIGNSL